MAGKSFFMTYLRPLIPFPRRKTLRRWFPSFETRNIVHLLHKYGIDTIVDIGANEGQFVGKMRSAGFRGQVISFEPIGAVHGRLRAKAQRDRRWTVAPRMALGDHNGEIEINVYPDTSLSSALPLLTEGGNARRETVPVRRLDDVAEEMGIDGAGILLKVDVQGLEKAVFAGAPDFLSRVKAIFLEVSLIPVYEGETSYLEMLSWLRDRGFNAVYFAPVLNRQRLGEAYQMDALLVRL